ncbi:type II toxin-antitoxin system VapB family antitoxin [soil metagenome]
MRTTLILDDEIIARARELTGVQEKTKLIHMGLEALIQKGASKRLAALGGTMKNFTVPGRDRNHPNTMVAEAPVTYKVTKKSKR